LSRYQSPFKNGDFPNRAFMRAITEHNLKEALALLPEPRPEQRKRELDD
jgi:hypothetical protein